MAKGDLSPRCKVGSNICTPITVIYDINMMKDKTT